MVYNMLDIGIRIRANRSDNGLVLTQECLNCRHRAMYVLKLGGSWVPHFGNIGFCSYRDPCYLPPSMNPA